MDGNRAAFAEEPAWRPAGRRRRVISGILHVLEVGWRWCDCLADYCPSTTIYNRFNHWSQRGFWVRLLAALVDAGGGDEEHRDRQHVHQDPALWIGVEKGPR